MLDASDKTKRQLLEEIRVLRTKNAKLESLSNEIPDRSDQKIKSRTDQATHENYKLNTFVQNKISEHQMRDKQGNYIHNTYRMMVIGVGLIAFFWIIESIIHAFVFNDSSFMEQILPPNDHDLLMRLLVCFVLVWFSIYAQTIVKKLGQARVELQQSHDKLENRVRERTTELTKTNEKLITEIGERKKAEELIREQNKFLNNILASMSHPFIVIDADNYNVKVAYAAAKRAMLSEEMTCHMFSHKLDRPCDSSGNICPLKEIKKTGRSMTVEHTHYDNNSNPRYIEVHSHPVFDDRGNVSDVIEYFIDITERKLAEERAEQHKAEFIHVSRLSTVGEMASGLAHELNQPLCAILSCSELCLQNTRQGIKNPGLLNENLRTIATQAERAGNIIRRIRDFLQKQDTPREPVDINNLIRETLNFINTDIKRSNIKVNIDIPKKLPKVMADAVQIEQVLINLLLNAIEAMADTDVEKRSLTIKASEDSNNNIKVMIRDHGHGLIPETKKQLFNPFFSTKPDGLGIGLSISHSIIEAHNGDIWAKPNPDCGSTFVFTLPTAQ